MVGGVVPVCGGCSGGGTVCVCGNVCFCVLLHVGGMLFECVLSESCFLTAICSSKEALGPG